MNFRSSRLPFLLGLAAVLLASCSKERVMPQDAGTSRIVFLHPSTGEAVWKGGIPSFVRAWNAAHGTNYEITAMNYPATVGGHTHLSRILPGRILEKVISDRYPWENYPYDYWNLWVAHTGESRDRGEWNLDDLARRYDVIVFKHCFPVSRIKPDDGAPDVSSPVHTLANYKLQYEALKARMHQFPKTRFIVWTGSALTEDSTNPEDAERAREFAAWVKETWDEKGDNIFVWDFRELETEGGLFLKPGYADGPKNSHPAKEFAAQAAPRMGRRIVDVIEGRGDTSSLSGE
jgi:hypothetical protein